MAQTVQGFYDALAEHYHLIFENWDSSIERQAKALNALIRSEEPGGRALKILDCACGIGTQAIGLAAMGHRVVASDLSPAAIRRAQEEARRRSLDISFCVSDMTDLREITERDFDVAIAMDNALPHLTPEQLRQAIRAVGTKLKPGGLFIASIRDYDKLIVQKPVIQAPAFYGKEGERRIVHQVWDWIDEMRYTAHLYITVQSGGQWKNLHLVSEYRCLLRKELAEVLKDARFGEVRWLMPAETGFYQPIVLARLAA
jgi:glycine/sarcosine N-methyltransferase